MCDAHVLLAKQLDYNRIILDLHPTPFDLNTVDGAYVLKGRLHENARHVFIYHGAHLAYRLSQLDLHHVSQEVRLGLPSDECLFCLGAYDASGEPEPVPSGIRPVRRDTVNARRAEHTVYV